MFHEMKKQIFQAVCLLLILMIMIPQTAGAQEHDIRIHTFAVPAMKRVNVRREPAGSIRETIDPEISVYILDTQVKRNKTWCRVIVFGKQWYQAYIQADYLVPLHDMASDVIKVDGGANHALMLRADGTCFALGASYPHALNVSKWQNIADIASARFSCAALSRDGTVCLTEAAGQEISDDIKEWKNCSRLFGQTIDTDLGGIITGIDASGNPLIAMEWETYDAGENLPKTWRNLQQFAMNGTLAAALTKEGVAHLMLSPYNAKATEDAEDLLAADGTEGVKQFAIGNNCLVLLMQDGTVRFFGENEYGAEACEAWSEISMVDACEQYVIGLTKEGKVLMAGRMESRDCHPGVYATGEHAPTFVNFSEDGQLNAWTDMISIDASGQFILGIHADGSPDMIGSYRYN